MPHKPARAPQVLYDNGANRCLKNRFAEMLFHYDNDPFYGLAKRDTKPRVSSGAGFTRDKVHTSCLPGENAFEGDGDFFGGEDSSGSRHVSASRYIRFARKRAHKFPGVNPHGIRSLDMFVGSAGPDTAAFIGVAQSCTPIIYPGSASITLLLLSVI